MKRYLLSAAALCFAMAMSAQSLFVGSYNIRYHNSDDDRNGNVWKTRCKVICDQVNFESPDIFGAQEVLHAAWAATTARQRANMPPYSIRKTA